MTAQLLGLLNTDQLVPPLSQPDSGRLAGELSQMSGLSTYPRSIAALEHSVLFLGRRDQDKYLGVLSASSSLSKHFDGEHRTVGVAGEERTLKLCPTTPANAAALRRALPFLVARPLGLQKSVGCGDRLGLATPGHIRAIRHSDMAPILAQQSMRENARTGRSPQQVMDEAMWGVFQEGWREGYGADADHLKTLADVDLCTAAGYTFYTIDPGDYVDNAANTAPVGSCRSAMRPASITSKGSIITVAPSSPARFAAASTSTTVT